MFEATTTMDQEQTSELATSPVVEVSITTERSTTLTDEGMHVHAQVQG